MCPRDARALVLRAGTKREQGDLGRALDDVWRATVVAPNDGAAWAALADLLRAPPAARRGRPVSARRARELGEAARGRPRRRAAAS
ncbi:MAG: hypothetical protein KF878_11290 [Planctomycetes bacterium]|nr:hypothetical protein [Planctomycetota bacterium]